MMTLPAATPMITRTNSSEGLVVPLFRTVDDATLVRDAIDGQRSATVALYDRYAPYVRRVLGSVLGPCDDLADVLHDSFEQAFRSLNRLEQPERFKQWLRVVAVNTARGHLRSKRRRQWLSFFAPEDMPEPEQHSEGSEAADRVAAVYRVLDAMPEDERVPLCLRWIEELELTEVAEAVGVSLATVKRKLDRARARFVALSRKDPTLAQFAATMEGAR